MAARLIARFGVVDKSRSRGSKAGPSFSLLKTTPKSLSGDPGSSGKGVGKPLSQNVRGHITC